MKVFLDIDGVMVHGNPNKKVEIAEDGFYVFLDQAIAVFNSIPVEEIILSTSHKNRFTLIQWEEILRNRGLRFDKLSKIESESLTRSRRVEIEWWLAEKKYDINEVIILDDDKTLNGLVSNLKDRVVLTSSYRGLCEDDLSVIQSILNKSNTYQLLNVSNKVAEDTDFYESNIS